MLNKRLLTENVTKSMITFFFVNVFFPIYLLLLDLELERVPYSTPLFESPVKLLSDLQVQKINQHLMTNQNQEFNNSVVYK